MVVREEEITMKGIKISKSRFAGLQCFRVFTVWYDAETGIIDNLDELLSILQAYYLTDVLRSDCQDGNVWVEYLGEKRKEFIPRQAGGGNISEG